MKNKIAILALGLWAVTIAVFVVMMLRGNTVASPDTRTAISMNLADRDFVAGEMRTFITNLTMIHQLVAENKIKEIGAVARKNGQHEVEMVPPHIMVQLPMEFKQMGFDLHAKFDQLAQMAEEGKSKDEILAKLPDLYASCVSCHSTYRILIQQ